MAVLNRSRNRHLPVITATTDGCTCPGPLGRGTYTGCMCAFQRKQRRWVIDLRVRLALATVIIGANLLGSAGVFVFATWVIPEGPLEDPGLVRGINMLLFAAYLAVSLPAGTFVGARRFRLWNHGTEEEQRRRERRFVLYGPLRLVIVQSVMWLVAAMLFTAFNLPYSPRLALR